MKRVIVESPYKGNVKLNVRYARACIRDCLMKGEAPIASHLLYTQNEVLDDNVSHERWMGITAGWAWMPVAELIAVYDDLGITTGMDAGIERAKKHGILVKYRQLPKDLMDQFIARSK